MTKLTAKNGDLCLNGYVLVYRYKEGDCDTISWPNPDRKQLASILYDEIECGNLTERVVLLPNGDKFEVDQ